MSDFVKAGPGIIIDPDGDCEPEFFMAAQKGTGVLETGVRPGVGRPTGVSLVPSTLAGAKAPGDFMFPNGDGKGLVGGNRAGVALPASLIADSRLGAGLIFLSARTSESSLSRCLKVRLDRQTHKMSVINKHFSFCCARYM